MSLPPQPDLQGLVALSRVRYAFLVLLAACGPPSPSECSTRSVWTEGNEESPLMHPGGACISCHGSDEGPRYTIAGTIFPTMVDPTDCNGSNGTGGAIRVVITGLDGNVLSVP